VGLFFIDTGTGQVATHKQLLASGDAPPDGLPPRPWLKLQGGSVDSSTLWFAVLRRKEKGIFIGTLVLRHSDHHALLLQRGWEDVPIAQIQAPGA
jgi:hypothetical protein